MQLRQWRHKDFTDRSRRIYYREPILVKKRSLTRFQTEYPRLNYRRNKSPPWANRSVYLALDLWSHLRQRHLRVQIAPSPSLRTEWFEQTTLSSQAIPG